MEVVAAVLPLTLTQVPAHKVTTAVQDTETTVVILPVVAVVVPVVAEVLLLWVLAAQQEMVATV